jgi:hypothetical protein
MNRSKRVCLGAAQSGGSAPGFARFGPIAPHRLHQGFPLRVLGTSLSPATWGVVPTPSQRADAGLQQAARPVFVLSDLLDAVGPAHAALLLVSQGLNCSGNCQTLRVPRQSRGFP